MSMFSTRKVSKIKIDSGQGLAHSKLISVVRSTLLTTFVSALLATPLCAELKELDDKSLKEQEAKAGITIDLETQLKIGEVYWDISKGGNKQKVRKNYMPEPMAPITYDLPNKR